jgi:hypothetical protein
MAATKVPYSMIKGAPVSVLDYGAVGDGVADDTTALNDFLAAVSSGARGHIPAGTYKFTSALNAVTGHDIFISGDGDSSVLLYTGASTTPGNLLTFGDGTTTYYGLRLEKFMVGSSTSLASGAAVRVRKTFYIEHDIVLNGPTGHAGKLYHGLSADNCAYTNLHQSRFYATNKGLVFSNCLEIHMGDAWVGGVSSAGVGVHLAGNNAAFYSERCRQLGAQYGLLIDNSVAAAPNIQIFLGAGSVFDTNATAAAYVNDTGTATISKFIHADAWFGSTTAGSGLAVVAWTNGKIFSGLGTFINNSAAGINVTDYTVTLALGDGVKLTNNGTYGVSAGSAFTITSSAVALSNTSGAYHPNVSAEFTMRGMEVFSSTPTVNWCQDFSGNTLSVASGANAQLAVGSGKILVANPANGDVGEYNVGGAGVTFIGSTAGSFVSPTATPAAGKVSIAYNGSSGYNLYSNYGSTQSYVVALVSRVRSSI